MPWSFLKGTTIWQTEIKIRTTNCRLPSIIKIWSTTTNSGGSIALHQMKLQTRRAQNMKAYDYIYQLLARRRIPTDKSKAENDQRSPAQTYLRMRRWANTILTGIYNQRLTANQVTAGGTRRASVGLIEPHTREQIKQIVRKPKLWCLVTNFLRVYTLRNMKLQTC